MVRGTAVVDGSGVGAPTPRGGHQPVTALRRLAAAVTAVAAFALVAAPFYHGG